MKMTATIQYYNDKISRSLLIPWFVKLSQGWLEAFSLIFFTIYIYIFSY